MTKTLNQILNPNNSRLESLIYSFAKDLTLKQFLETCPTSKWILWLFNKTNPTDKRLRILVNAYCANTARHLMKDERSKKAIDIAVAYGKGEVTYEQLESAAESAAEAAGDSVSSSNGCAATCAAAFDTASAVAFANIDNDDNPDNAARKKNQELTADICRKHLPLKLWNF